MYYIRNNGTKKTPFHVLLGLFVYNTDKSKNIITALNRVGLSISYDEILRIRTRLALYTGKKCEINVPIPSHFDKNSYVTAAFDNFDHNEATISGLNSTHDTVLVIKIMNLITALLSLIFLKHRLRNDPGHLLMYLNAKK